MMPQPYRKLLIFASPVIVVVAVLFMYLRNLTTTRPLTVSYENVRLVSVMDISSRHEGGKDILLAEIKKSGETVRVKKNVSIFVTYRGVDGYTDGFENATESPAVHIQPDYSASRISEIIASQRAQISAAVLENIQNANNYTLDSGTLYDHGLWYISRLVPKDDPEHEKDTLRVLVKKERNGWRLVGGPMLVFTTFNTRGVPVVVLNEVNKS